MNLIEIKTGAINKDNFEVVSGSSLVTGLLDGSFTKTLVNPAGSEVSGSIMVTVAESAVPGLYDVMFTPNAAGRWLLSISHPTYFPAGKHANYRAIPQLMEDLETESSAAIRATANQTEHDATQTAVSALPTPPTVGAIADAVWDETTVGHTVPNSFGTGNADMVGSLLLHKGTLTTVTSTTVMRDSSFAYSADTVNKNQAIVFFTGPNAKLARKIVNYVGATKEMTLDRALPNLPTLGDVFVVLSGLSAVDTGEVDRIVDGVLDEVISGHLTVGTVGKTISDGAAASATPSQIAQTVWDELSAGHVTVGSFGKLAAEVHSNVNDIPGQVWNEPLAGHVTAGSTGEALGNADAVADPSATADAVWNKAISGFPTAGTFGKELGIVALDWGDVDQGIQDLAAAQISGSGTVTASTSTIDLSDLSRTETATNFWSDQFLMFTSGPNKGQVREIVAYNGTVKKFTFDVAFSSTIVAGHTYVILPNRDAAQRAISGSTTTPTVGTVTINRTPVSL